MSAQITESQRSALTALVDTYVPALAVPQDRTGFWAYRASDAGVDGTIEHVLSDQLPQSARAGLQQLLDALADAGLTASTQEVREGIIAAVAASSPEAAGGSARCRGPRSCSPTACRAPRIVATRAGTRPGTPGHGRLHRRCRRRSFRWSPRVR